PFGLMLVLALLGGYWQLRSELLRRGLGDDEDASAITFACGLIGILGGKIYYAILVGDWGAVFDRAGIVWYGCLIAGAAAFIITVHQRGLPLRPTLDAAAPALPLGYAIGRIGCLLVGDDYGVPSGVPWAMTFEQGLPPTTAGNLRDYFGVDVPASIPDSQLLAVHPTQIYMSLASFVIWGLARWLGRRADLRPGRLLLAVLAMMSVERFLVEFLRAKDDRFFGLFTVAQLLSVVIVLAVVTIFWRWRGASEAEAAA
ncbi:MAG: prolipoprotein diacylglyceryl transferase family protein, partial [Acidobacteriota bacterium]